MTSSRCRGGVLLFGLLGLLGTTLLLVAAEGDDKKPAAKEKKPAPPPLREWKSGIEWPEPAVVDPGPPGGPPADAVVLFDGKTLDAWKGGEKWEIANGEATAKGGDLNSKESFGDCQLHLEYATPAEVRGRGQGRGNSGVKLMSRYEVQILDSFDNKTYFDGQCASIYKQKPPLVNACRKPGEWQTLDIVFEAPRFDAEGKVQRPAYLTVLHNGLLVHNHFALLGTTAYDRPPAYRAHGPRAPLNIQYHGNPVKFRNIWLREVPEMEGKPPANAEQAK